MEEECQSSESGWTMYIGSPVEGGEDDDDHYSDPNPNGHVVDIAEPENFHEEKWLMPVETNDHDENSDDSMASDASSGPSFLEKTWEINRDSFHQEANKVDRNHHHSSKYKDKKPAAAKKNRHEKRNDVQEKEDINTEGEIAAKYFVQGSKVRKNHGWGKQTKS